MELSATRKESRMRRLFTVLVALALLSASACGGGGQKPT